MQNFRFIGATVSEFCFFKKKMKENNTENLRKSCLPVFCTLCDIFMHFLPCCYFFTYSPPWPHSDCLSLQLKKLTLCSKDWNLRFNEDKCVVMRYCSRREPLLFNYYINGQQVVAKLIHRDLGVLMSDNLHWTDHYDLLLKRAYKVFCLLRRNFHNVKCVHTKKVLYISLVRS